MSTNTVDKNTFAFGRSLAIVSILNSLLVILKERSEPLMGLMKTATGHHWITHGLIVLLLFLAIGFVLRNFARPGLGRTGYNTLAIVIAVSTFFSGLILVGFLLFS